MCLGIPGKITSISSAASAEAVPSASADHRAAQVDFSGVTQMVRLDFVPEARVGDFVLVHVGVALSVIDEAEAEQTLQVLRDLGEFFKADELSSETSKELNVAE